MNRFGYIKGLPRRAFDYPDSDDFNKRFRDIILRTVNGADFAESRDEFFRLLREDLALNHR